MAQVNVTINGKVYRMACDDGQEKHLETMAEQVNATIEQLRGSFGEIGDQRLTVMTAITMCDGLAEANRKIRSLEDKIAALNKAETGVARAVEHVAQRIEGLTKHVLSGKPAAETH